MIESTYRDALRQALDDAMARDPSVMLIGEEVGVYGGAYGVTKGLIEKYGAQRVIDTPISEAGFVGAGVGAAMAGLRPVVELMYVDFAGIAMDQIANQAAKIRAMFGGQIGVPMVIRTQGGTGRSAAAQHSQSLEAWFMHVPGLRVAMPGTVSDAYHLLTMALTKPDPVIFIEHKALYTMKGSYDPAAPDAPWGTSVVRREGKDAVILTYSRMLHVSIAAAATLAESGIEVAVIDLRTLNPMDIETAIPLVQACGRAVVVTEACLTAGPAAEIGMRLVETCFDWLEEPVIRIAGEDVPIPVAPALESASIPTAGLIVETITRLVRRR